MNKDTVSGDIIDLKLRQLKASKIVNIHSNMYIVDFQLENGILVSYVFNITKKDKYFLQRMRPYAMVQGKYADTREIADFIKKDIEKFRNAEHSSNFQEFVAVSQKSIHLAQAVEQLFLNKNVEKEELEQLSRGLDQLLDRVEEAEEKSHKIYAK